MSRGEGSLAPLRVLGAVATPLVREGLRIAIGQASGLVWLGATANVHAVRGSLGQLRPQVVLLDNALDPRGELIRSLGAADPTVTVVALLDDRAVVDEYVRIAKAAGAHGVVAASATPARLAAAIRNAHHSRWFVDPELVKIRIDVRPPVPVPAATALSERQRQVLDMIADGMSSVTIAERLMVSPETVRSHIKLLLRRLGAKDRAHAVSRAYQLGVLAAPDGRLADSTPWRSCQRRPSRQSPGCGAAAPRQ